MTTSWERAWVKSAGTNQQRLLRRVVELWTSLCNCPGQEWAPSLNNYKLKKHSQQCEYRLQVEANFRGEKEAVNGG